MVIRNDEPVLEPDSADKGPPRETAKSLRERIRDLVTIQPFGVLCTHGEDHAYGSLVAFAFADDLRSVIFATPIATRKYRLLSEHDRVALVVDNRPSKQGVMMDVEAVTATGQAVELACGPQRTEGEQHLLARHPHLKSFVASESCAVFRIDIIRFFHVSRFQEVRQWVPNRP